MLKQGGNGRLEGGVVTAVSAIVISPIGPFALSASKALLGLDEKRARSIFHTAIVPSLGSYTGP